MERSNFSRVKDFLDTIVEGKLGKGDLRCLKFIMEKSFLDDDGEHKFFHTQQATADMMGVQRQLVNYWFLRLMRAGLIEKKKGYYRVNI